MDAEHVWLYRQQFLPAEKYILLQLHFDFNKSEYQQAYITRPKPGSVKTRFPTTPKSEPWIID